MFTLLIGLLYSCIFSDFHSKKSYLRYYCSSEITPDDTGEAQDLYFHTRNKIQRNVNLFSFCLVSVSTVSIQASWYYLCVLLILNSILTIIIFRVWTTEYLLYFYLHGDYSKTNSLSDIFRQMYLQDVLFLQKNWFSDIDLEKNFFGFSLVSNTTSTYKIQSADKFSMNSSVV
jgi:hypothetical protein